MRAATLLVLAFSLLWQAIAMAAPGSSVNLLDDATHGVLHWKSVPHHHLDDEPGHEQDHGMDGWHTDDSDESVHHVMADPSGGMGALPSTEPLWLHRSHTRPASHRTPSHESPCLDGPLRPPR